MLYLYPTWLVGIGEETGNVASFHPGRIWRPPDGGSSTAPRRQGALAHRDQPGRGAGAQDPVSRAVGQEPARAQSGGITRWRAWGLRHEPLARADQHGRSATRPQSPYRTDGAFEGA